MSINDNRRMALCIRSATFERIHGVPTQGSRCSQQTTEKLAASAQFAATYREADVDNAGKGIEQNSDDCEGYICPHYAGSCDGWQIAKERFLPDRQARMQYYWWKKESAQQCIWCLLASEKGLAGLTLLISCAASGAGLGLHKEVWSD